MSQLLRLLLTDADVVAKLSNWYLLDRLPVAFNCSWTDMATLPSLVHRAYRARQHPDRLFPSSEVADHAWNALGQMSVAPAPNPAVVSALQRVPDIDGGEAVLFGALCAVPSSSIVTGDKRALKSIAGVDMNSFQCSLSGRVICLEQVLLLLLNGMDFTRLRSHIAQSPHVDRAVAICFGSRFDIEEAQVISGLQSYISDLRTSTGGILAQ